jgi:hypothetical protein
MRQHDGRSYTWPTPRRPAVDPNPALRRGSPAGKTGWASWEYWATKAGFINAIRH